MRLAALVFAATFVAILAGVTPAARWPLFALDLVLAVAVAADALMATGKRVEIQRLAPSVFSVGRENAVSVHLHNASGRRLRGLVADDPLADAERSGLPAPFDLPPHASAVVRYRVTPTRRGPRAFRAITVRYASVLGLVQRQERTELPASVDVYPDVHAARALELLRRQGRQDVRLGSLRVHGGDTEFERLRPYQRGDEIRHLDWRATARRDDLTVRQFQAESNQNVMFALDIGRGMRGESGESGGLTAVDHALNAALLAADVAVRGGDKAGLMAFDDATRAFLPPAGGRSGGRKLTRAAYALEPGMGATDYRAAMAFLRAHVRARSLLIVFTNLLEPRSARALRSAMRGLLPHHLPLCVLMRDMDIEQLATAPAASDEDLYVRAAAAEVLATRDELIRDLRKAGALVLDARPHEVTPKVVSSYLEIKARRLL